MLGSERLDELGEQWESSKQQVMRQTQRSGTRAAAKSSGRS